MADRSDDEDNRQSIRAAFDLIESFLALGRSHMRQGGRADIVDAAVKTIAFTARSVGQVAWPDMKARALAEAKNDKSLQRLLKKASRKAPI